MFIVSYNVKIFYLNMKEILKTHCGCKLQDNKEHLLKDNMINFLINSEAINF